MAKVEKKEQSIQQNMFTTESASERIEILSANAERKEEYTYSKQFTKEELIKMKDDFAQKSIVLSKVLDELAEVKEEFKQRIKPLQTETSELLSGIKTKAKLVTENVYLLANQVDNVMEYRNNDGELVNIRQLLPEERQTRMLTVSKTGTNN